VIDVIGVLGVLQMDGEFRYERREKKLESKRKRMKKHGRNIATIYKTLLQKPEVRKAYNALRKKYKNIRRDIKKRIKHEHATCR